MLNWYYARQVCHQSGKYIQLLNNKCDNYEDFKADKLWHNTFIKERIIWNTSIVTDMNRNKGYSCIGMKLIEDSYYILTAQNCNNKYYSLCQKDVSDNFSRNTEQTTGDSKGTNNVSINTKPTTKDSKVSMYVGIAVALTILPIAVIVLAVCIRRHRIKVVVTEPAAISNSDHEYENVQENVNTDYHTLNLELVGETNDYSTLQPNVPDYIEIR
ncbi:uncharacterized protein LOC143044544 [Mytilus galloprovincialis]|uniref:uncharacterized protein LOC143044544 n=1 Tax=Mytilus galloprovincialis TaxID=29158 RepID=UPI003F7C7669